MLNRMLLRDLFHLRGQVIAAALVVACGVGALVATRGTYDSLIVAQARYYEQYRFADVFAHLTRAPESLGAEILRIPGVSQVLTRVVVDVTLDVPGLDEPAIGRLVSTSDAELIALNGLHLLRGRHVLPQRRDEVLVSESFALANGLDLGARLRAVLNGRLRSLVVVGIAMSPEYVYEVGKGMLFPDNRRFGVMWMDRAALAPEFNLEGAFNDLALSLSAGAEESEVVARLDRLLERYGGLSAYTRKDQVSNQFLTNELGELRIMTTFVPSLFLGVASFLLNVVLSRLVSMQRAEIGLLKAFGRTHARIGLHYLAFATATALLGLSLGIPLGLFLGSRFVRIYQDFFHFPRLSLVVGPRLLSISALVTVLAAAVGALNAALRAVALPPAEAMRPTPPSRFKAGLFEHAGLTRWLRSSSRMILRNVTRRPWKALLSVLGIALAVGLMVVGRFTLDAANHILAVQFGYVQRDDVTVLLAAPRSASAGLELSRLPGVLAAEPFRLVPVWLRHEHKAKRVEIIGLPDHGELRRLVDRQLQEVELPREGLVLSKKLAEILGVGVDEGVRVEVLEGARISAEARVVAIVDEMLGLGAYMDARALARFLYEDASVSGAYLKLDPAFASELYATLKRMPAVGGVSVRGAILASIRATLDRSFAFFGWVLLGFSCVIVAGMVYNSVRIALSERGNELASLRVLGFTEREVAFILLGEQGALTLLAIPIGLLVGYGLCALLVPAFDRDMFRLPLVIGKWSYVYAALAALAAAVVSGLLVARRLRHLDLIGVLKTRE